MPIETQINANTAESLRENIIRIAQSKSMSYDTISRRCMDQGDDVSKSTIAAFFTNPSLDLGYKKLMAISRAVSGYDIAVREFTEPLPLKPTEEAEYMRDLMEAKKDRILALEKQIMEERDKHKTELAEIKDNHKKELSEARSENKAELKEQREEYEKRFASISKDKKVWRGVALFVLIAVAFCTILDMLDTNSGWIQSSGINGLLNGTIQYFL